MRARVPADRILAALDHSLPAARFSVRTLFHATSLLAALALISPLIALAQHDHHGSEAASYGLGQSFPPAANVSLHPAWRLYVFERDGISYYQVNNDSGQVQLIIAKAGPELWALPAGHSYRVVSLPSNPRSLPPGADRRVVFIEGDFALALYGEADSAVWSVEERN